MPLFIIIIVVSRVEVEHIFTDQDKPGNTLLLKQVCDFPPQSHDITVQAVIPLSYQLNNRIAPRIVGVQDFKIQRTTPEEIPLWVDVVIVNGIGEIKFVINTSVQRRFAVL